MSNDTSMSVTAASKHARQNPDDAFGAIQALFDYVEGGGDDASSAATSLALVAGRSPAAFDSQTDRFEHALKTADGVHTRRNLAEAVNELLEQHAIPPRDAGPALTEATRIRDDEYWEDRPKSELSIIREGLIGWTDVAAMGEPVPKVVVKRAAMIIDIAKPAILINIRNLFQAAVASGSPMREQAFDGLVELAATDNETLTSEATISIAELVLSGNVPDEDAAREVITANAEAVRRDTHLIEQALEEISS